VTEKEIAEIKDLGFNISFGYPFSDFLKKNFPGLHLLNYVNHFKEKCDGRSNADFTGERNFPIKKMRLV